MTSQEANHRSPQSHGRNRDDRFTIKNDETAVNHQKPASSDRRRHLPLPDDEMIVNDEGSPSSAQRFNGDPPSVPDTLPPIAHLLDVLSNELGIEVATMQSRLKPRYAAWCRSVVATLAVGRLGYKVTEVGAALKKNPGTVSRWCREGLVNQSLDPRFRSLILELEEMIVDGWVPSLYAGSD